jgi:cytochrome d ubiquinol oxidase subunit II
MAPETIVAGVLLAALVVYALSGGADFGGGMWDMLARGPRARAQRHAIEEAIGPIWEANHVWLILVVTVLFTAFPPAFAAVMIALHIPLTAVLLGIVLRGSAFVFRKYDRPDDAVHRRWSTVFGAASALTPFFLGLCLGGVASGEIRVAAGQVTSGFLAGWTSPFALGCGLLAQALFGFLAAVYLTVDTARAPALQADFRRRGLVAGAVLIVVGLGVFGLARAGAPVIAQGLTGPRGRWVVLVATVTALAALGLLWAGRFAAARAAAILEVALIVVGWGLAQYPHLVVADLTIEGSRAAPATLVWLLWALAAGAVLLFPSFAYLYWVFKARDGGAPGHGETGDRPRAAR